MAVCSEHHDLRDHPRATGKRGQTRATLSIGTRLVSAATYEDTTNPEEERQFAYVRGFMVSAPEDGAIRWVSWSGIRGKSNVMAAFSFDVGSI